MSHPVTHPEPGTRLGDFQVDGLLGSGGGGTVYAARWGHRAVALKLLREDLLGEASERRRFVEEARILAEINHPGVVRVLGFGDLPDGRPYLAMERLVGESLAERIGRGPLPLPTALTLFDQLAQAVQALHQRSLVHRDIKPENVFLVQGERYAVLLDFGIAKPLFSPDSTVTRQGGVRGTPAYMAPERFFGAPASTATDIYELGVVLYLMLTGSPPWEATDDPVTRLNPRRPSELEVHLPGRLEEILLRSLSTRAENRPRTATELAGLVAAAVMEPSTAMARLTADIPMEPSSATARLTADIPMEPSSAIARLTADIPMEPSSATARLTADIPANLDPSLERSSTGPEAVATTVAALPTTPQGAMMATAPAAGSVTTASAALGQTQPAPPLPSMTAPRRPRRRILALAAGLGAAASLGVLALVLISARAPIHGSLPSVDGPHGQDTRPGGALVSDPEPPPLPPGPPFDTLIWGLHPPDTHLLIRLRQEEMRRGAFWKALVKGVREKPYLEPLRTLVDRCPVDVVTRITWLSLGLSGDPGSPSLELIVSGDFKREEVEACLAALSGKPGDAEVVRQKGPITRVRMKGHYFFVAWPDEHTFLVSSRPEATESWLRGRLARRPPLGENTSLLSVYRGLDPTDTLLLVTTSASFKSLDFFKDLPDPLAFSLSLAARDAVTLRGAASFSDEGAATLAEERFRRRVESLLAEEPAMALLLKSTRVSRRGNVVQISFEADARLAGIIGAAAASGLDTVVQNIGWTRDALKMPSSP